MEFIYFEYIFHATLNAFRSLSQSLAYIVEKKPTCNPQKRGTCTCSTFSSIYSFYEDQFLKSEPKGSIEHMCRAGNQEAEPESRNPGQESDNPSQRVWLPSQGVWLGSQGAAIQKSWTGSQDWWMASQKFKRVRLTGCNCSRTARFMNMKMNIHSIE